MPERQQFGCLDICPSNCKQIQSLRFPISQNCIFRWCERKRPVPEWSWRSLDESKIIQDDKTEDKMAGTAGRGMPYCYNNRDCDGFGLYNYRCIPHR